LGVKSEDILLVSGRTGEGVEDLLKTVVERVPSPAHRQGGQVTTDVTSFKSLVFDFKYSNHRGVIVFLRVISGEVKKGDELIFKVAGKKFQALEVGTFLPKRLRARV
jgi:GTP-binding protein LepA